MEKLEYGDLYKFLVSAGIVLIGFSIFIPWIFLKEPFDLLVSEVELLALTKEAQLAISKRQILITNFYNAIPIASIVLALLGIISIVYGLSNWFKKQGDFDKRDLLTTQKLQTEVQDMTFRQVAAKNTNEFKEAVQTLESPSTTTTTTSKEQFISKYLEIEQFIINKSRSLLSNKFTIHANSVVGRFGYDLILKSFLPKNSDVIIEIKYFPLGVAQSVINEALYNLQASTTNYAEKVKANVMPILFVIVPEKIYDRNMCDNLIKNLPDAKHLKVNKINVQFLIEENLDDMSHKTLLKLYPD